MAYHISLWLCLLLRTTPRAVSDTLYFGFPGYVMSDWGGTHSGVQGAMNGLDMDMPGDLEYGSWPASYFNANLTMAVQNGSVPEARLDDMAQRVMAGYFLLGQDQDYPEVNFVSYVPSSPLNEHVNVQDDHYKLIRHIGASSTVLLKNANGALPLKKPTTIAVIGNDMGPSSKGPNGYSNGVGSDGTLAMGWGSGTATFPYLVDPLQAISTRAQADRSNLNFFLNNWDLAGAANAARGAEVALVGINANSGELLGVVDGNIGDRNNLSAWQNGDNLVSAVAAVNPNTVVVVHSVGQIDMESWIDNPNVTAVLWAGLPGQESGNALVDVLYGEYNPVGRLPYTIAKQREDYPADLDYVNTMVPHEPQVNYTEGIFIDYRHFQKSGIAPRFWFGQGLSYTTFAYSDLHVGPVHHKRGRHGGGGHGGSDGSCNATSKIGSHLSPQLHDPKWRITATVTNTGDVYGCDVPQLYLVYPEAAGEPPKVLRDFDRVSLDPGCSETVEFTLSRYDVSIWDEVMQKWVVPEGTFKVTVAQHAGDDDGVWGTFCPSNKC